MNFTETIGRLLGYEEVASIDSIRPSFGASWAHDALGWVVFGCLGLAALSIFFYLRFQTRGTARTRLLLGAARGTLLCLLLVILADPILEVNFTNHPRPLFWVLFDGTDSMSIRDELPSDERNRLDTAVDLAAWLKANEGRLDPKALTRADYIRALLNKPEGNLLKGLAEKFRLRAYVLDRPEGVRAVELTDDADLPVKSDYLAGQLTTEGQVTALGNAFEDLSRRHATDNLSGLLVVSDFDQNAGAPPLAGAKRLNVPIFTLGVGARSAIDLAVDLQTSLKMKKAETTSINVTLRQQELEGRPATVRVTARRIDTLDMGVAAGDEQLVGERTVTLSSPSIPLEFPFTPEQTGRFVFKAEALPLEGEIVDQNNRAEREVTIIDDFLRLLFVEYEPTWEWRFVKEVFHRDKLVGMRGFRTYLRSSDPAVREANELFMPSLTLPRNEFFQYDVLFLGDMPAATLSTRFCEMTKEFVGQFGGGLVVMAGPRFGPGELAKTPLADMLPVVVDPDSRLRDDREFPLQLTPTAPQYDFMRLGQNDAENSLAWNNLGDLQWYQPVRRLERTSTALAVHPADTCVDGKSPQPLIAIRKYGRGEVVYVAFNEMWRLRRKYGEVYYRQFWGQLIHRLGLSHALGAQKRFVVRTDRQQYQADDHVLLTVEAYDQNFEPLSDDDLSQKYLDGELILPTRKPDGEFNVKALRVTQLRQGVYESRVPVFDGGEYRIRVTDPVTKEVSEVNFQVTSLTAERRSAVRNVSLQQSIAAVHPAGKAYELDNVEQLLDEFNPPRLTESRIEIFPLWSTWFYFLLVVLLMLGEWFFRKMASLA